MLTWPCQYTDCGARSTPEIVDCTKCGKHLCVIHTTPLYRPCVELDDDAAWEATYAVMQGETSKLLQKIRDAHLDKVASSMRPGHASSIDIAEGPTDLLDGGYNIAFIIDFDDGVKWVARILNEATRLVPKFHLPPATDRVGHDELQYLFLDFVDGEPLHPAILNGEESPQRLAQVIPDYALFRIKIKSVPFDRIGSIYPDPLDSSSTTVGPLIDLWFRFDDPPHFLGPFLSNKERYLAQIDFTLEMVERGKLYPDDPNLIHLFHLDLRALIHLYQKWEEDTDERKFYLKHADDKGAHIFVNDEGHITGIIDWEWAYVTSKAEAFSPPLAMILPSSSWDGDNTLSSLEEMLITEYVNLGHSDLAKCVQEGKFYQRLNILLGYHPELNHLKALREIVTGDKICFANDGEYKDWCLTRYGEDEGYLRLLKNTIA